MSEETRPDGQVESALEQAKAQRETSEESQQRELLKLTGGLRRISIYVTEEEHLRLCTSSGEGTIETLLEAFIADLIRSKRSIWKECQIEAKNWHTAHNRAEYAQRAFFNSLDGIDEKGDESC